VSLYCISEIQMASKDLSTVSPYCISLLHLSESLYLVLHVTSLDLSTSSPLFHLAYLSIWFSILLPLGEQASSERGPSMHPAVGDVFYGRAGV
jgi:hypothetical protein